MRFVFFIFIFCCVLLAVEGDFNNPDNCKGCHRTQVQLWEKSWHSKNNAELYNAVLEIVAKEQERLKAEVIVECSVCHNPTLSIHKVDNNYVYSKMFDINNSAVEMIDKTIKNSTHLSGISCFACHKVDSIKIPRAESVVGSEAITLIKNDKMFSGPYDDAIDEYHTNTHRSFFNNKDDLCLTCHNGIPSIDDRGLPNITSAYTTGDEMTSDEKKCIDCHMGEPFQSIGASGGSDAKIRLARPHLFAGAHDIRQIRGGILLSFNKEKKVLRVINTAPHMAPTGFGGRLIQLHIAYEDKDKNIIKEKVVDIGPNYEKDGKPAIKYIADVLSYDSSLAPNETRELELNLPEKATSISVQMLYYYLNPLLVKEYNLEHLSKDAIGPVEVFSNRRVFRIN